MIPTTSRRSAVYTGTGAVFVYAFGFKVFQDSDVQVVVTSTLGVESTLVLGTDYTVTRNADQATFPGGSINLVSALALSAKLVVIGATSYAQTTQLPTGGNYNATIVEAAMDRIVMQVQQILELGTRTVRLPTSETGPVVLPALASRASQFLACDASGNIIAATGASGTAISVAMTPVVQAATVAAGRTLLGLDTKVNLYSTIGGPPRAYIAGLLPSTAGASATMTISAGEAADGGNTELLVLAAAINKTTSAWAVGTGNGGLDTGAIANSTPYFFWLIKRPDTGVVDVLISLSATAPTMPASYTLKRLIGWGRTNGSAQWLSFTAYEQGGGAYKHVWALPTQEMNTAALTTARILSTPNGVPVGVSVEAHLKVLASNGGATCAVNVQSPDETDAAPAFPTPGLTQNVATLGTGYATSTTVQTGAAGTIAARSTAASTSLVITCVAFVLTRR